MRRVAIALVLALLVGGTLAACEPAEADYKINVKTEVRTWDFNGVTQGAEREDPVVLTAAYELSEAEFNEGPTTLIGQDDPEWVNREESTTNARYIIKRGGTASASGCRAYTQYVDAYSSAFNSMLYKYKHRYTWCWYLTTVYNPTITREIFQIAENWGYEGLVDSYSGFYDWGDYYHNKGGYRWYRKLHFEGGCLPIIGNCYHRYPWNKFWAHANGTYSTSTSDMQSDDG
jgi:hypothetical protein